MKKTEASKNGSNDYVIRVLASPLELDAAAWNALLVKQDSGLLTPFMRYEYLAAMHESGSATTATGWTPRFVTLWHGDELIAGCALYLKAHSYGEYVFDWAWANAYQQHGLPYYPKAVVASPFTPVPGPRLLARDAQARALLVKALIAWCSDEGLSSLHLLFASDDDVAACEAAEMMLRHTVQFHWSGVAPTLVTPCTALPPEGAAAPVARQSRFHDAGLNGNPRALSLTHSVHPEVSKDHVDELASVNNEPPLRPGYRNFDDFLHTLNQEKRKKIRQERRKVREAGVEIRSTLGTEITSADWDFFYRCYERTYYEHGNAPYLSRDFFERMARTMPENWLMFVAERDGQPIASSLIAVTANSLEASSKIAYGRYWGALERVDCLHFELCYYQPLAWCIAHGYQRFEGGAQGEHKMARALLPVKTTSAHWLAHPAFADAIERFLSREGEGIEGYIDELERRSPFKQIAPS